MDDVRFIPTGREARQAYRCPVVVEQRVRSGGAAAWRAVCPSLEAYGAVAWGRTCEHALKGMAYVLEDVLGALADAHRSVPLGGVGEGPVHTEVIVTV